jgi:DNA polymerase-3 subunit alpha
MFGFAPAEQTTTDEPIRFVSAPEWSDQQRLWGEKETLGLFLTGHPIDRYESELGGLANCRISELKPGSKRVAGLIVGLRTNNSKRGRMAIVTLDDRTARVEVVAYAEAFQKYQSILVKDQVVVVEGICQLDDFSGGHSLTAERVWDIDGAREAFAKRLVLRVDAARAGNGFVRELEQVLSAYKPGACAVAIDYARNDASVRLTLSDAWRVRLVEPLVERLQPLVGKDGVRIEY